MKRNLTKPQEQRLLHKHLTGDCGPGRWESIQALLNGGYLTTLAGNLVVTDKGREYCAAFHREIR